MEEKVIFFKEVFSKTFYFIGIDIKMKNITAFIPY